MENSVQKISNTEGCYFFVLCLFGFDKQYTSNPKTIFFLFRILDF